jgi:hypothetical protein
MLFPVPVQILDSYILCVHPPGLPNVYPNVTQQVSRIVSSLFSAFPTNLFSAGSYPPLASPVVLFGPSKNSNYLLDPRRGVLTSSAIVRRRR